MKQLFSLIFVVTIFTLVACDKEKEPTATNSEKLIGYWVNPTLTNDTIYKYEKANSLKDNDFCFAFKAGNVFIERKNAGWCGTPPIAFGDFEGTWIQNDSIVNITVAYWGGLTDYRWKIIAVDNNSLTLYRMSENTRPEN